MTLSLMILITILLSVLVYTLYVASKFNHLTTWTTHLIAGTIVGTCAIGVLMVIHKAFA